VERNVKWAAEAKSFFESAADNSVVLDIVISYACASQTGEGFEDLVNTINGTSIKNKIKKIIITDTSYLYRHCIPEFAQYSESDVPTMWFLNNKDYIDNLTVDTTVKSWADGIKTDEFKYWHKKILADYGGDQDGNGIIREFRDLVYADSAVAAYKGNRGLEDCVDFMLEECAYVCAFLRGANLVYPMSLARCMENAMKRYNSPVFHLAYKTSRWAQRNSKHCELHSNMIDREVVTFMKEKVEKVNFFVIDKFGNHIYKNYALDSIIGDVNAKKLSQQSWSTTSEVIRTKKQISKEEHYNGKTYYSIKAPLIINDNVEGVIGLAVDLTAVKQLQQLAKQKEMQRLAGQIAHDIRSPLLTLSMLLNRNCSILPEKDHIAFRNVIANIDYSLNSLLEKYHKNEDFSVKEEDYICVRLGLQEMVNNKKSLNMSKDITFNYKCNPPQDFTFIKGNYSSFCRMISNLLDNAVEAIGDRKGFIDVDFIIKDQLIEICIKDNGKGMPQNIINKITSGISVTGKKAGHGIGMQQITDTLQATNGKMSVKSTENVGTEITLTFPKCDAPSWFSDRVVLYKGDTVVVLDDDASIHEIWKDRFASLGGNIKAACFTQGQETVDFINSLEEKDRVFLFADYELRGQGINGVDVIERSGTQNRSLIVTSVYISRIKKFAEKCRFLKIFFKIGGVENISFEVRD
jgi:signal transduction histidine kinase